MLPSASGQPERVLILTPFYFPDMPSGAPRLAYDLAKEFERLGHEVWLLAQSREAGAPPYQIQDGLHVLRYYLGQSHRFDVARHQKHIRATKRLLSQYLPAPPAVIHGHD